MRKGRLLNGEIIEVIARMGHTDEIVIADAGLPIPPGVRRIDLAVEAGLPGFIATLEVLLAEYQCQGAVLAREISEHNPDMAASLQQVLGDIPVEYVSHQEFKMRSCQAKAIIRTGECTPYANIILQSGVIF